MRNRLGLWLLRPYLTQRLLGNIDRRRQAQPGERERYWMGRTSEVWQILALRLPDFGGGAPNVPETP